MKVYVLEVHFHYDGGEAVSVHTTKAKAIADGNCLAYGLVFDERTTTWQGHNITASIREMELDWDSGT